MFELIEEPVVSGARIKVIGTGGAGGNAINTMMEQWPGGHEGVDFIAANTDLQALKGSKAPIRMQLGTDLTRGLGAGADPEVGRKAAIESETEITKLLTGADMIFITAGMGGGTGTGSAPVIARIAKDLGALTIGVVTKPFSFEGKRRGRFADKGIEELAESVDSLITIPNERLLVVAGKDMAMVQAFKMADEVLLHAVRGISDLILVEGLINLDFADIRAVMSKTGMTLMGSGLATGEHRSIDAATRAISSPLLENISIRGATGILLNVTGGKNLTLYEVNEAAKLVQEEAHEDANIIFGSVIDEKLGAEVRVTVIATGFEEVAKKGSSFTAYQKSSVPSIMERERPALNMVSAGHTEIMEEMLEESSPRAKIPVQSDLRRIMGDLKNQNFSRALGKDTQESQESYDEYDIPTFLRKHAD